MESCDGCVRARGVHCLRVVARSLVRDAYRVYCPWTLATSRGRLIPLPHVQTLAALRIQGLQSASVLRHTRGSYWGGARGFCAQRRASCCALS